METKINNEMKSLFNENRDEKEEKMICDSTIEKILEAQSGIC